MGISAAGLASLAAPSLGWAQALDEIAPRRARRQNLHTGEAFDSVYFEGGEDLPDALSAAMRVLRDRRTGEQHIPSRQPL